MQNAKFSFMACFKAQHQQYFPLGNGPVCQVETSPEIFNVYRAYLVMTVHKILAADMRYKGAKKLPKVGAHSSNSHHRAQV
jgi:hypothetical protein